MSPDGPQAEAKLLIKGSVATVLADIRSYSENRSRVPVEALAPYAGQYVAWSPDGRQILASGADPDAVEQHLAETALDPAAFVIGYVDLPEEVFLG
jgi:hypothetical protein